MKNNIFLLVILVALFFAGWMAYKSNMFPIISAPSAESPLQEEGNVDNGDEAVSAPLGKCYVGGCSSQICSDQPDVASTCEFREEYACYQRAKCERQPSGACGWTPTPELSMCLSQAQ